MEGGTFRSHGSPHFKCAVSVLPKSSPTLSRVADPHQWSCHEFQVPLRVMPDVCTADAVASGVIFEQRLWLNSGIGVGFCGIAATVLL